jgi:hypothetical protein
MIPVIHEIIYGYLLDYIIFDIKKINWGSLSENSHPDAIKLLMENPDKIDWEFLSQNPNLFLKNDKFCDEVFKILQDL